MKVLASLSAVAIVASSLISQSCGQQVESVAGDAASHVRVDILSDTKGADIGPYMQTVILEVKEHWTPPPAQATRDGSTNPVETVITFSITPEGHVKMMLLMRPGNLAFDRAARSAIANTSFPPLPVEISDAPLKLRISFPAR
jgi:TonB family protein